MKEINILVEFAIRELGGTPTDIIPYTDGTYGITYGSLHNYDFEEYICHIENGKVILH